MYTPLRNVSVKESRILIVDDEPRNLASLERVLTHAGHAHCIGMQDPREAIRHFVSELPDLLVLDWHMEPLSGAQVLEELQRCVPAQEMPPVLVLTADDSPETKIEALALGATDFLAKPLDQTEVLLRIRNLLQLRQLHLHFQSENRTLDEKVGERTAQLQKSLADLEQLQQQVIQQERLRALGAMASGIAHDFNNALTIIKGYSDMLLDHEQLRTDSKRLVEYLETINQSSCDASGIVRRLQAFSRPYDPADDERENLDINKIAEEAVQLSVPKWKTQTQVTGICIDMQLKLGRVPSVWGVGLELRELLINLIFNAVDAMPQGGSLTIRTVERAGHAVIEVEDSGTGMTDETRRRCLEPFYTTKGEKGSGMGLSTTYGIVQRHGGTLDLVTELNHGTKFTVSLPVVAARKEAQEVIPVTPARQHLRVLVVDDQPDICTVLHNYLTRDNHEVVTAENGCAALERFRSDHFDLVITDRAMPKMNGDQLASAIREINPGEPIILMTAFMDAKRLSPDVNILLRKPLSLGTIRDAIGKVMADASSVN